MLKNRPEMSLPYQPRVKRNDKTLPEPLEDVAVIQQVEEDQQYRSPPPPPPASAKSPVSQQGQSLTLSTASPATPATASSMPQMDRLQTQGEESNAGVSGTVRQRAAQHLHPHVSRLPSHRDGVPDTLTPLRAHYLKKTLVNSQIAHELNLITDPVLGASALGLLGDPFVLPESAKKDAMERVSEQARVEGRIGDDLPFTRFLFHQFVLPFPFLASAPPTFWSAKVQPFVSAFLTTTGVSAHATMSKEDRLLMESMMTPDERKEQEERNKLWARMEKHSSLMVGVGVKVVGGEEVVRIGQADLRRLEEQQELRRQRWMQHRQREMEMGGGVMFDVNVVGVRSVMEKGRVRSKSHDVGGF